MLPYGDKLNLKTLFQEEKETSDTRQEDKEHKTAYFIYL